MRDYTSNFDFKDRVILELQCIIGAFGLIRSLDCDRIVESDLEMFGNAMAWRTEFLRNELEAYFYPNSKKKTPKVKRKKKRFFFF